MQQRYGLSLVTAPATEPLSLAETKLHLKIDDDQNDEDALVLGFIQAARERVETLTGRALITQTWDVFFDRFPASDGQVMTLPKPPLQSVTSISYVDQNGQTQVWAGANYLVDAKGIKARITPVYGGSWPSPRDVLNAVTVRMVVGYGVDEAVPQGLKAAMKLLIGHWWQHRSAVEVGPGLTMGEMPIGTDALMRTFRVMEFA